MNTIKIPHSEIKKQRHRTVTGGFIAGCVMLLMLWMFPPGIHTAMAFIEKADGESEKISGPGKRIRLGSLVVKTNVTPETENFGNLFSGNVRSHYGTNFSGNRRTRSPLLVNAMRVVWNQDAFESVNMRPSAGLLRNWRQQDYLSAYEYVSLRMAPENEGLWDQFFDAMNRELIKKRHYLDIINDIEWHRDENCAVEMAWFALYEDELEEISYIKRDIAVNTLSHALADTVEKTPPGRAVKRMEETVRRYMTMEYSKGVTDTSGMFYLPGQTAPSLSEDEREYAFKVSSLFHVDPDDLNIDISLRFIADFKAYAAKVLYDFSSGEASAILQNRKLNAFLNAEVGLAYIYDEEEAVTQIDFSYLF